MSLIAAEENPAAEIHVPANIDWEMLNKSKFFFLDRGCSLLICFLRSLPRRRVENPTTDVAGQDPMFKNSTIHHLQRRIQRFLPRFNYFSCWDHPRSSALHGSARSHQKQHDQCCWPPPRILRYRDTSSRECGCQGKCRSGNTTNLEPYRCREQEANGSRFLFSLVEKIQWWNGCICEDSARKKGERVVYIGGLGCPYSSMHLPILCGGCPTPQRTG